MKQPAIILTEETIKVFAGKLLLLDTDILVDASIAVEQFADLFQSLKASQCKLFVITPVLVEFLRGSKSLGDMQKKKQFIESTVDSVIKVGELPTNGDIMNYLEPGFLLAYGIKGKGVSYTDYEVARCIKNHGPTMLLLTGNYKHFPEHLFDRLGVVTNTASPEIKSYGIYQFADARYKAILENLTR
jgi:hypothetical protein